MKIWTFSDLHFAFSDLDYDLEFPDADICVVAGDVTAPPLKSVKWLQKHIGHRMPVVAVAGNHEYYGQVYVDALAEVKANRHLFPDVHFLENEELVIGGVRFLGATLWTDFDLYERQREGMKVAHASMNDYRTIMYRLEPPERLTPQHVLGFHQESRRWLEEALARPFDGETVVVSHTCPHEMSIHPQYAGDPLNPAFTSDLSAIIKTHEPAAWLHGHTHASFDYVVPGTRTRVVCNPRGYVRQTNYGYSVENMMFERYKVIEIRNG
jgi:Icc-related predicted phosphoesterase